ncbi:MAG: histidine phosphatase family protein [Burkholderiaceae bacterium]
MKTLYLLRHGEAAWGERAMPDRDRPLLPRGEQEAAAVAIRWSQTWARPGLILSSPAVRALASARIVAHGFNYDLDEIAVHGRLYDATRSTLISVIEGLDDGFDAVMLVGHNPGLTDLARHLDDRITPMATGAVAGFRFDTRSWAGLGNARPVSTTADSPNAS